MLSITTTRCYGHPELVLAFDAMMLETDALWFAGTLEQMVQSGSRFQAGQSLPIGWSVACSIDHEQQSLVANAVASLFCRLNRRRSRRLPRFLQSFPQSRASL